MAHSISAEKRIRQNEARRLRNKARASEIKTIQKRVLTAVQSGDKAAAERELKIAQKKLDKAAKANTLHANAASRRKSQLARKVSAM